MKNTLFTIALAIIAQGYAQAQVSPASPSQTRFFIGTGLTAGGDEVISNYGDDKSGRAGSGTAVVAGIDYTVNSQFSLQANVGIHVNALVESESHVRFQRFPIELLAYYHLGPQWRVGIGARSASNAKVRSSGDQFNSKSDLKNSTGSIVEAEYRAHDSFGVKVRYVSEEFKREYSKRKIDANHVGIFANYYF